MIYGLIACGGKSSRMGQDKSLLQYHDAPQVEYIKTCLAPYCEQIFISIRAEQLKSHPRTSSYLIDLPDLHDLGPMAALLTAFHHYPTQNFLLIGCDYPLLKQDDLKMFIENIQMHPNEPIAFFNPKGFYEPLLAYYPAQCAPTLQQNHAAGMNSLQRFLIEQQAIQFTPKNLHAMRSVDTLLQHDQVLTLLSK
jgi:molybdopterin-guanine dinucleotide biosynthesis protein A